MQQFMALLGVALLVAVAIAYGDPPQAQPRYILPIKVIHAIDGDSFRIMVSPWPGQHNEAILRLDGWDAPESTWRAQCDAEGRLGQRAEVVADSLIGAAHVYELSSPRFGKFGGRVLATLLLDGEDIAIKMEALGLLERYSGQGKKPTWCPEADQKGTL